MIYALLAIALMSAPDPSPRTRAWRVIDTVVDGERCDLACSPYDPIDPDRDTACIQAAITRGIMNYRYNATELPAGDCYINARLEVMNTTGYALYGHGMGRTTIYWDSATPADPMLYIGDVAQSHFYDFELMPGNLRTVTTAINMDNCAGCFLLEQGSSLGIVPGHNIFERINIGAPSGGQTLVNGIVFGVTEAVNNEFHTLRDFGVSRYHGDAAWLQGSQQKSLLFENFTCLSEPSFVETTTCVRSEGCFTFIGGGGGSNDVDFYLNTQGCPVQIMNANFETSKKFLRHGANNGNRAEILLQGVRWESDGVSATAAGTDRDFIESGYSGGLVLIGNHFGTYSGLKPIAMRIAGLSYNPSVMIGNAFHTSLSAADRYPVNIPFIEWGTQGSRADAVTFDAGTDRVTWPAPHELVVGSAVQFQAPGGSMPAGVASGVDFFVQSVVSPTVVTLSSSYGGGLFDVTTAGSGVLGVAYNAVLDRRIRQGNSGALLNAYAGFVSADGIININNGTTTITDLAYGYEGQVVTLWAGGSAGRTVAHDGANIDLNGDVSFTMSGDDVLTLQRLGGVWTEVSRAGSDLIASDTVVVTDGVDSCTMDSDGTFVATQSVTATVVQSVGGVAQLTSAGVLADDVLERSSGAGVTVEGVRFEDVGSSTYEVGVGPSGSSTVNVMGAADTSAPYSLTANVYGDVDVKGSVLGGGVCRLLYNRSLSAQTTGTAGYEALVTLNIGNSLLANDGDSIEYEVVMMGAANANTKSLRQVLDGSVLQSDNFTVNNTSAYYRGVLVRTSSTAGKHRSWLWHTTSAIAMRNFANVTKTWSTATLNLTFEIHTPTASTDATMEWVRVMYCPYK